MVIPTPDLTASVADRAALLQLGEALFWNAQVGSEGQACASCHYHAGADARSKNQLNPGFRSTAMAGGDQAFGNGVGGPGPGAVFRVGGQAVRSVEPRNTPTVINAVFNQRNFWDARARSEFNGVDPIGQLDPGAALVETVAVPGLALVAFLEALTDERVRWERAPFDHPSPSLPNGGTPGRATAGLVGGERVLDDRVELPEVGAAGSAVPLGTSGTPWAGFLDPLR